MKKRVIWTAICVILLSVFVSLPVNATQYDPPWADNFGFDMGDFDTTDMVDYIEDYQEYAGYNASGCHDWNIYDAVALMEHDAIWLSSGHGRAGAVIFQEDEEDKTELRANSSVPDVYDGVELDDVDDLDDLRLLVFIGCNTANTNGGNLLDVADDEGVDATVGFSTVIYWPHLYDWGEQFIYEMAVEEENVTTAAYNAKAYVWGLHLGYGNTDNYEIEGNASEKIVPDGYGDT